MDSVTESRGVRFVRDAPPEFLFVVSASAQYAGAVVAVRLFDEASPATIAWIRVLAAGVVLLLASARRGHAPWTRHDIAWAGVFGTTTALMNIFFYLALDRLPLGKGVTIEFIGPITVAAIRTRSIRNFAALSLAALGVVVLGGAEIGNEPLGLLFILLASLMWAGYIVVGSRVAMADRGVAGLGLGLVVGGILVTPIGAGDAARAFASWHVVLGAALVGILSNAIGYGIDQTTMRRIPVRRFSVMLALLPVTAAVFGFVFLGQEPTSVDMVGMMMVLAGVAIQEREVRERPVLDAATS